MKGTKTVIVALDFAAVVSRMFAVFAIFVQTTEYCVIVITFSKGNLELLVENYENSSSVTNSANRPCTNHLKAKLPSLIERPLVAEMTNCSPKSVRSGLLYCNITNSVEEPEKTQRFLAAGYTR